MAPVLQHRELCITYPNASIDLNTSFFDGSNSYNEEDKHALLYIVCTLLFYSLGIMIGIVSYIKREKQDIEQDRMFHDFLTSFRGKTEAKHNRQLKVQETIERLAEIERLGGSDLGDHDSEKMTRHGIKPGKKRRSSKFANFILRTPHFPLLNSRTSIATINEPESDIDDIDPFQNRRLSEVVAEMIKDDSSKISCQTVGHNVNVEKENAITTAINGDSKEQKNVKESCKESLQSVAEDDLYKIEVLLENATTDDSREATATCKNLAKDLQRDDDVPKYCETFRKSLEDKLVETNISQKNLNVATGELSYPEDIPKLKWSVTSV